jgi:hypothetical protein
MNWFWHSHHHISREKAKFSRDTKIGVLKSLKWSKSMPDHGLPCQRHVWSVKRILTVVGNLADFSSLLPWKFEFLKRAEMTARVLLRFVYIFIIWGNFWCQCLKNVFQTNWIYQYIWDIVQSEKDEINDFFEVLYSVVGDNCASKLINY